MKFPFRACAGLFVLGCCLTSALRAQKQIAPLPPPTHAAVAYGEHPNQIFDFWAAEGASKVGTPLVIYIHGGGFTGGSKDSIGAAKIKALRAAGFHVASVEYRFLKHAKLPAAHEDAIRAIQFIRSQADNWHIDDSRVGAFGGSAGAQLVAYLAWHDDFADPDSEDPIARQSTRLAAVAPLSGQSTMDLDWWIEHIPGYNKPHNPIEMYLGLEGEARDALMAELSIINHISADDPPVFMHYSMSPDAPIPAKNAQGWMIHHVNFGLAMKEKLDAAGVEVTLSYPGAETRYKDEIEFLIAKLRGE